MKINHIWKLNNLITESIHSNYLLWSVFVLEELRQTLKNIQGVPNKLVNGIRQFFLIFDSLKDFAILKPFIAHVNNYSEALALIRHFYSKIFSKISFENIFRNIFSYSNDFRKFSHFFGHPVFFIVCLMLIKIKCTFLERRSYAVSLKFYLEILFSYKSGN